MFSFILSCLVWLSITNASSPLVNISNGTISGKFLANFNQDVYLGIPYAEPPIKDLRFKPPIPLQNPWNEVKQFINYSDACYSAGGTDSVGLNQSEDCLTLNIVKPHGDYKDLPVAVWIHGGSFNDGSSSSPTFNASWIVETSVCLGKPIIVVSINYRLNGFGFLHSEQTLNQNLTNIGLRDQIKAVEWIHENIEGFGGNPDHLILWGESAGGKSVGRLLNNNKYLGSYIKGGILESGANVFVNVPNEVTDSNQDDFNKLLVHFNCTEENDQIECLQNVDSVDLQKAFNITNNIISNGFRFPIIDGDIVPDSGYETVKCGKTTWNVPLLIGTNTDEGSIFTNTSIETLQDSKEYLSKMFLNLHPRSIDKLLALYPANESDTITPFDPSYSEAPIQYPESIGKQFKTLAALNSDVLYIAATKITSKAYVHLNQSVYKYRFNIPKLDTKGQDYYKGSPHAQEVPYVFNNKVLLSDSNDVNGNVFRIADTLSKFWISFINDLDPNFDNKLLNWPLYNDEYRQYLIEIDQFSTEIDDHRLTQFEYIEKIIHQLDG